MAYERITGDERSQAVEQEWLSRINFLIPVLLRAVGLSICERHDVIEHRIYGVNGPVDCTPHAVLVDFQASKKRLLENPRRKEAELRELRAAVWTLQKKIAALDPITAIEIEEYSRARDRALQLAKTQEEFDAAYDMLREPRPPLISDATALLAKMEDGLVVLIREMIDAQALVPGTGRVPDVCARLTAIRVAQFMREVAGEVPAKTGRFGMSPLETTLQTIFDFYGIKTAPRKPAEFAIEFLKEQ